MVAACTAGKGSKVASFVGKIFVVRPPTTKTTNILPHENYPLYGIWISYISMTIYTCTSTRSRSTYCMYKNVSTSCNCINCYNPELLDHCIEEQSGFWEEGRLTGTHFAVHAMDQTGHLEIQLYDYSKVIILSIHFAGINIHNLSSYSRPRAILIIIMVFKWSISIHILTIILAFTNTHTHLLSP